MYVLSLNIAILRLFQRVKALLPFFSFLIDDFMCLNTLEIFKRGIGIVQSLGQCRFIKKVIVRD